jgi:hypothetical protein
LTISTWGLSTHTRLIVCRNPSNIQSTANARGMESRQSPWPNTINNSR